jgi:hypothetical protein
LQSDLNDLGLTVAIGVDYIFVSRRDCLAAYQATIAATNAERHSAEANVADGSEH